MRNVIQTHIFDRSDPDEIISSGGPKGDRTRLDEIRAGRHLRNDVAMVNVWGANYGDCVTQTCVYGKRDGAVVWNGQQPFFTVKEQTRIRAIVRRMADHSEIAEALLYP